jgi:hypothetical protein
MVAVLSIKQADVFFKSILYVLKGVKGEVPKIDKFLRRAVSFVMCFLQKAERRERERETSIILTGHSRVVKSRRMRWAGHVARMGDDRDVQSVLVGKPEGKSPLGRPRRKWEDNIKMGFQEVGGGRGDWMELAQDRDRWRALVGTVRDFRVP